MDYSHPYLLALRRAGQRIGILRPMVRTYRKALHLRYEESFDKEVMRHIQPGDTVWDVGANVGLFTAKFADVAGASGQVIAFEPSRGSFAALREATRAFNNVQLEKAAVADFDGTAEFQVSTENADPTNSLAPGLGTATETVTVVKGDSYRAANPRRAPHRIKIDVEGFECEVLHGLVKTLKSPELRSVFIEVHFAVLNDRGLSDGPARMTALLKASGFRVTWADPSHIVALKS